MILQSIATKEVDDLMLVSELKKGSLVGVRPGGCFRYFINRDKIREAYYSYLIANQIGECVDGPLVYLGTRHLTKIDKYGLETKRLVREFLCKSGKIIMTGHQVKHLVSLE